MPTGMSLNQKSNQIICPHAFLRAMKCETMNFLGVASKNTLATLTTFSTKLQVPHCIKSIKTSHMTHSTASYSSYALHCAQGYQLTLMDFQECHDHWQIY